MAINIRFDYFNIKLSKERKRKSKQGQQYFGDINLSDFCTWLHDYCTQNPLGEHGTEIFSYNYHKKWIKWVGADFDKDKDKMKLLFSFNDKEVDPRLLADSQDNVLAQPIPDESYGQRTLLHIVISPQHGKICVQNITGFGKEKLQKLIIKLLELVAHNDIWTATDPVTEKDVLCRPCVEINFATTDTVLSIVKNGGLRGLVITERKPANSQFDKANHLTQQNTEITIRAEPKNFVKKTKKTLIDWANKVTKEKSNADNPQISLLIKDPQTQSEVKHEILNNVIDGFSHKCFLNWKDRDEATHSGIGNKTPTPIAQFYAKMIENF
ncbi:hypothetical protein [Moraxella bovis]|uniref:Uncharacterized protein n=1 Tax=Moraxella bovis TaxID=476 RepID=A0AAX3EQT4_MORBO|nr:hypothetical protein [Moraxella bovis]UZA04101.1 hypothetical protein LP092_05010 [Moraxella bovis]UZA20617.1 hypothetical protein LP088_06675 [Moraxella bovis]UZA50403.1 hypothetical protein LP129_07505 [Moraxella bovis]UZA52572.1 hypothetical protein LP129_05410 [Moraxella bovis]